MLANLCDNSRFCDGTKQWLMVASARSQVLWGMQGTCMGVCACANDHVAALHVRGGLRMRSKRTTAWQLLTCSQIETKLLFVSLCFWSLSIPIPLSLVQCLAAGQLLDRHPSQQTCQTTPLSHAPYWPSIWTMNTSPMPAHRQTGRPACGSTTTLTGTNRQTHRPRKTIERPRTPTLQPRKTRTPTLQPRETTQVHPAPVMLWVADWHPAAGTDGDAVGTPPHLPNPRPPLLAARPRRAVGLAPLSPAGGEPLTTLTGTGSIVAGITPTLRELSPSLDLSGKRSFEVSLLISLSYWGNSQWVALRALTLTHVLKNVG